MEIVLRATVVYFALFGIARAMGRRELSELTVFELILLVTIGDMVQQGITQEDMSLTGTTLAVGTFSLWILLFSYVSFRWVRVRRVVAGRAVIVLRDGEPLMDVLKMERVPLSDLEAEAREQGIGDLADVRLAVMEEDGKFSFITSEGDQNQGTEDTTKT